MNIHCDKN